MTCRRCVYLDVPPRSDGKIVPSKRNTYNCVSPLPTLPKLPKSIPVNENGWNAFKWPPRKNRMTPDDGEGCTFFKERT